jgi:hypothetical protein
MDETTAPPTHYFMATSEDWKLHRYDCRIVRTEMRQGWKQPHEWALCEYTLGDGKIVQGWIERWRLKAAK